METTGISVLDAALVVGAARTTRSPRRTGVVHLLDNIEVDGLQPRGTWFRLELSSS